MTRLSWGDPDARRYETGVDRGVLYPPDDAGVVWNGLVNVQQAYTGGDVKSLHYDGIKYLDFVSPRSFQATLTAFSAPEEFSEFVGNRAVSPGFILTNQPRRQFGLSYRTLIDGGPQYLIHIVYNALASPSGRGYSSLAQAPQADTFSWTIDAVPSSSNTHRPSSHYIFDSTKTDPMALSIIEDILYGTDDDDPRLPAFDELVDIVVVGASLIVVPDTVAGLADLIPGEGDLYVTSRPGIHRALPGTRLLETIVDGLYELEE